MATPKLYRLPLKGGSVNAQLADAAVGHQVGLLRYGNSTVVKILKLLEDSRDDLEASLKTRLARIAKTGFDRGPVTTQRVAAELKHTQKLINSLTEEIGKQLQLDLEGLAVYEAGFQHSLLSGTIPIATSYIKPGPEQLKALVTKLPFNGQFYGEHISNFAAKQFQMVATRVQTGVVAGLTLDEIARNVIGTPGFKYSDGVWTSRQKRSQVETLVRTSVNHVATSSREELYSANRDVIKEVEIIATLDGRTTLICQIQDGKVYPIGKGPRPPFHYNCRTTTAPVVKSLEELIKEAGETLKGKGGVDFTPGHRAMLDGVASGKTTYEKWLRGQSALMQNFVLGTSRGRLFRANPTMRIDKFADKLGRQLTLADLAIKEAHLFSNLSQQHLLEMAPWLGPSKAKLLPFDPGTKVATAAGKKAKNTLLVKKLFANEGWDPDAPEHDELLEAARDFIGDEVAKWSGLTKGQVLESFDDSVEMAVKLEIDDFLSSPAGKKKGMVSAAQQVEARALYRQLYVLRARHLLEGNDKEFDPSAKEIFELREEASYTARRGVRLWLEGKIKKVPPPKKLEKPPVPALTKNAQALLDGVNPNKGIGALKATADDDFATLEGGWPELLKGGKIGEGTFWEFEEVAKEIVASEGAEAVFIQQKAPAVLRALYFRALLKQNVEYIEFAVPESQVQENALDWATEALRWWVKSKDSDAPEPKVTPQPVTAAVPEPKPSGFVAITEEVLEELDTGKPGYGTIFEDINVEDAAFKGWIDDVAPEVREAIKAADEFDINDWKMWGTRILTQRDKLAEDHPDVSSGIPKGGAAGAMFKERAQGVMDEAWPDAATNAEVLEQARDLYELIFYYSLRRRTPIAKALLPGQLEPEALRKAAHDDANDVLYAYLRARRAIWDKKKTEGDIAPGELGDFIPSATTKGPLEGLNNAAQELMGPIGKNTPKLDLLDYDNHQAQGTSLAEMLKNTVPELYQAAQGENFAAKVNILLAAEKLEGIDLEGKYDLLEMGARLYRLVYYRALRLYADDLVLMGDDELADAVKDSIFDARTLSNDIVRFWLKKHIKKEVSTVSAVTPDADLPKTPPAFGKKVGTIKVEVPDGEVSTVQYLAGVVDFNDEAYWGEAIANSEEFLKGAYPKFFELLPDDATQDAAVKKVLKEVWPEAAGDDDLYVIASNLFEHTILESVQNFAPGHTLNPQGGIDAALSDASSILRLYLKSRKKLHGKAPKTVQPEAKTFPPGSSIALSEYSHPDVKAKVAYLVEDDFVDWPNTEAGVKAIIDDDLKVVGEAMPPLKVDHKQIIFDDVLSVLQAENVGFDPEEIALARTVYARVYARYLRNAVAENPDVDPNAAFDTARGLGKVATKQSLRDELPSGPKVKPSEHPAELALKEKAAALHLEVEKKFGVTVEFGEKAVGTPEGAAVVSLPTSAQRVEALTAIRKALNRASVKNVEIDTPTGKVAVRPTRFRIYSDEDKSAYPGFTQFTNPEDIEVSINMGRVPPAEVLEAQAKQIKEGFLLPQTNAVDLEDVVLHELGHVHHKLGDLYDPDFAPQWKALYEALDKTGPDDWPSVYGMENELELYSELFVSLVRGRTPPSTDASMKLLERLTKLATKQVAAPEVEVEAPKPKYTKMQAAGKKSAVSKWTNKWGSSLGKAQAEGTTAAQKKVHAKIVKTYLTDEQPAAELEVEQVFTFKGGGTATGKTTLDKTGVWSPPPGSVVVDMDAIKALLPDWNDGFGATFVHDESRAVTKQVIAALQKRGINVVFDGTGDGEYSSLLSKIQAARAAGYKVKAEYVTVPTEEALKREAARQAVEFRGVPKSIVKHNNAQVSRVVPRAIYEDQFDELHLWDTSFGTITNPEARLIAEVVDGEFTIHDRELWDRFIAKGGPEAKEWADKLDEKIAAQGAKATTKPKDAPSFPSTAQAQAWAKQYLKTEVDYHNLDPEVANAFNRVLWWMQEDLGLEVPKVGSHQQVFGKATGPRMQASGKGVGFDVDFWRKNISVVRTEMRHNAQGVLPGTGTAANGQSIEAMIAHELAHVIQRQDEALVKRVVQLYRRRQGQKVIREELGDYAWKGGRRSWAETWAESFSAWWADPDSVSDETALMVRELLEMLFPERKGSVVDEATLKLRREALEDIEKKIAWVSPSDRTPNLTMKRIIEQEDGKKAWEDKLAGYQQRWVEKKQAELAAGKTEEQATSAAKAQLLQELKDDFEAVKRRYSARLVGDYLEEFEPQMPDVLRAYSLPNDRTDLRGKYETAVQQWIHGQKGVTDDWNPEDALDPLNAQADLVAAAKTRKQAVDWVLEGNRTAVAKELGFDESAFDTMPELKDWWERVEALYRQKALVHLQAGDPSSPLPDNFESAMLGQIKKDLEKRLPAIFRQVQEQLEQPIRLIGNVNNYELEQLGDVQQKFIAALKAINDSDAPQAIKDKAAKSWSKAHGTYIKRLQKMSFAEVKKTATKANYYSAFQKKDDLIKLLASTDPEEIKQLQDAAKAKGSLAGKKAGATLKDKKLKELAKPKPLEDIVEIDGSAWTRESQRRGSNPGGFFEGADGERWYVKFPNTGKFGDDVGSDGYSALDRLAHEMLANRLYQVDGTPVPEVHWVTFPDGKRGLASRVIEGGKLVSTDKLRLNDDVLDHFVMDAFLGNWDTVGLDADNLMIDAAGRAYRIDPGGSLVFRAQGDLKGKAWAKVVTEIDTLRDPSKNSQAAAVFKGLADEQILDQLKVFLFRWTPKLIDQVVDEVHATVPIRNRAALKATLKARLKSLEKFKDELEERIGRGVAGQIDYSDWRPGPNGNVLGNLPDGGWGNGQRAPSRRYGSKVGKPWAESCTAQEKSGVSSMVNGSHGNNSWLWSNQGKESVKEGSTIWKTDNALRKAVAQDNFVLFRGVPSGDELHAAISAALRAGQDPNEVLSGKVFPQYGFQHTCINKDCAFGRRTKTRIRIPKGFRGVGYAKSINPRFTSEDEFFVRRGIDFRFVKYWAEGNEQWCEVEIAGIHFS